MSIDIKPGSDSEEIFNTAVQLAFSAVDPLVEDKNTVVDLNLACGFFHGASIILAGSYGKDLARNVFEVSLQAMDEKDSEGVCFNPDSPEEGEEEGEKEEPEA